MLHTVYPTLLKPQVAIIIRGNLGISCQNGIDIEDAQSMSSERVRSVERASIGHYLVSKVS